MFSDVTVNPSVGSGMNRDARFPTLLTALAKRKSHANSNPTDDVAATFKEGERSPIREAAAA